MIRQSGSQFLKVPIESIQDVEAEQASVFVRAPSSVWREGHYRCRTKRHFVLELMPDFCEKGAAMSSLLQNPIPGYSHGPITTDGAGTAAGD